MANFTVTTSYRGHVFTKRVRAPSYEDAAAAWVCSLTIDDMVGLPECFVEEASVEISVDKISAIGRGGNVWDLPIEVNGYEAVLTIVQNDGF